VIAGTAYAGEIKKSIFTVLNYLLPERGVMPMHCSANVGERGDVAVFFGLSGTGKTTLSADATRTLIGDDEHGWGEAGVFNFEGGCYAKVIRLEQAAEPEIWAASNRFGAILENVVLDPATLEPRFDDGSLAENTRASYPLDFIANASPTGASGHPSSIVMLTADAFGVLPPISMLTPEPGDVPLPLRLHRPRRRHRARRDRAAGHLLDLLRRPLHAPPAGRLRRAPRPPDRAARLALLAHQHRLDGRRRRRRPPHAAARDPRPARRRPRRPPRRRRDPHPPPVRPADAGLLPRRRPRPPRPPRHLGRQAGYDQHAREVAGRFEGNFARFAGQVGAEIRAAGIGPG
jgi:hypothetical protein